MTGFIDINNKIIWIILFSSILIIFCKYEKEDFSQLTDYPPDPLPSISLSKYNYINDKDIINDDFESISQFNKLFSPNKNLDKPVYLMARSNGRVRQKKLIN
jgi:hypothetical protein